MKECPFCKKMVEDDAQFCPHCGTRFLSAADPSFDVPPYYQKQFEKFKKNDGQFLITWNWWAFLFGIFWYFYKGIWVKPLIMIAVSALFAGVPGIFFILYCALFGNYDYYRLKILHKQL